MKTGLNTALFLAVACLTMPAGAQDYPQPPGNLEKLQQFKTTGDVTEIPVVPQSGPKAAAITKTLSRIKLPQGFKIALYAIVPDARHMAVGPQGVAVFVGTRKTKVYAVTDRDKDRVADEVKVFAPTINFSVPNGVCFSKDGFLFVVEQNRVLTFPAAEFFYEGADVAAFQVAKGGELIPKEEESYNHTARVCRVGPDDKLYIALGQPFNVPASDKLDLYRKWGSAASSAWTATGKTAKSMPGGCAIPSAWTSTPRTRRSGSRTTRWTAWATMSRRAS